MSLASFNLNFDSRDDKGYLTLSNLADRVRDFRERTAPSLTSAIEKSRVTHRCYIQKSLASDPILNPLLMSTQNMIAGWILTAINLSSMVDSAKTMRDVVDTVATEQNHPDSLYHDSSDILSGFEHFNPSNMNIVQNDPKVSGGAGSKVVPIPDKVSLAQGRILEVQFTPQSTDDKSFQANRMTAYLFLQLNSTFIEDSVAKAFFATNFKLDMFRRWFQFRAGEINFFRDFLLEMDKLRERNKALKDDKTGQLKFMEDAKNNSLFSYFLKLVGWRSQRVNIASSIMIFEKNSFDDWCRETGCKFERYDQRQAFFARTFAVMVIIVDTSYQNVTMYWHGVKSEGNYSFSQLKIESEKNNVDLKNIMQSYFRSNAPQI